MDRLFAGLDISTQSAKLVLLNWAMGDIVYEDSLNYDLDLPQYDTKNGIIFNEDSRVSESDPLMWIEAVDVLFNRLKNKSMPTDQIKSISVSGQQHGLVALDKKGKLSRSSSKLWNDFSTQRECDLLEDSIGGRSKMIQEVGNSQRTGYTASKIYNMFLNERDLYDNTSVFLLVHNFINWYLTGGVITMEEGDASGMALWDPVNKAWSDSVINSIDINLKAKLPNIESSKKSIGFISESLAKEFGFSPDCTIDSGSGDNMYGAIGTGNITPGLVTISLGTSGTAYTFFEEPFVDPVGEIACFCDSTGNYLPLLCVSNMANGYNNFLKKNSLSHSDFDLLIDKSKPGNNGKIIIPWFEGERTPDLPEAAPIYFGFDPGGFNKKTIARGLLEGHLQNLYDGFKRLPVKLKKIHLTGGMSKSRSWCQTISDIFSCDTVPLEIEGAALGAALHASWVWHNENGEPKEINEIVEPFILFKENLICEPRKKYQKIYRDQSKLFSSLSKRVRGKGSEDPFKLFHRMVKQ